MIDDMLWQNWSTLHSPFVDLYRKQTVTESSPRGACFRDLLLNSFKHVLHNSITPHGMKIERFFSFHSRTRIKTLAQQRPQYCDARQRKRRYDG
jgi:hypothetical protein